MKSMIAKLLPLLSCILILVACDHPILEDAPYRLVGRQANTMVYGVYPQDDGTFDAITSTNDFGNLNSEAAIYRFDQDWNLMGKIAIPTDSLNIIKQCAESESGYWLTLQCFLGPNRYRYELLHIDRSGNELYRNVFANTDGMLNTDLFLLDEMGTLIVFNPDELVIFTFTNDGLNEDPLIYDRRIDYCRPSFDRSGILIAAMYSDGELTIAELDIVNREETARETISGFDCELDFDYMYWGSHKLVALMDPSDSGPIPSDNLLYLVDDNATPVLIPYKGYVVDFLDRNGETLILGAQKTVEKPKLTSLITIHKVKEDGSLELLESFDPKNLMLPHAALNGDSIILYGYVGHPVFGLTGFVKEMPLTE